MKSKNMVVLDSTNKVFLDVSIPFPANLDEAAKDIQVTYVTTQNNFQEIVIHIHNYGSVSHIIDKLVVLGVEIEGPSWRLESNGHLVKVVNGSQFLLREASVWTCIVGWDGDGGQSSGFGGRLTKEHFFIEDWPKQSDCPFPVAGANESNFALLAEDLSIDTHFLWGACEASLSDVIDAAARSNGSWFVFPNEEWSFGGRTFSTEQLRGVAAAFIGDEVDSSIAATQKYWSLTQEVMARYPTLAVYQGGHSNHYNGAFAGITDIQGMDYYVAGCAPHVSGSDAPMRVQGSYDYIRTSRDNHRPLSSWAYSQAWCQNCWPIKTINGDEAVLQLASVVAGGSKALMLFMTDERESKTDSWAVGGRFLRTVRSIRELLRVADVDGALVSYNLSLSAPAPAPGPSLSKESASAGAGARGKGLKEPATGDVIVQVLRAPTSLILIVINTRAEGYNQNTCFLKGNSSHWTFLEVVVESLEVALPRDLVSCQGVNGYEGVSGYTVLEVVDGEMVPVPGQITHHPQEQSQQRANAAGLSSSFYNGRWRVSNIALSSSAVARVFLFQKIKQEGA